MYSLTNLLTLFHRITIKIVKIVSVLKNILLENNFYVIYNRDFFSHFFEAIRNIAYEYAYFFSE